MAEYELFGKRYSANQYEQNYQKQYSYYSSGNSKSARGLYNGTLDSANSGRLYWLRSPSTTQRRFCCRNFDSEDGNGIAEVNLSLGLNLCFFI